MLFICSDGHLDSEVSQFAERDLEYRFLKTSNKDQKGSNVQPLAHLWKTNGSSLDHQKFSG